MATKHGLVVFNSDGNIILDVTDRLTKISGEADIQQTEFVKQALFNVMI